MLNYLKFIEILISLQSIFISTLIPIFISLPFFNRFYFGIEIPITWQIPTIIFISLIFKKNVVFIAYTIYLFLGLFIVPIFYQGGSTGYLLTPNFGYLIGIYSLIKIVDRLNRDKKIYLFSFIKFGVYAIFSMHIIGILFNFVQILQYKDINIFLYNIGKYSLGKIGYHFLMLIPLAILIKPINKIRNK